MVEGVGVTAALPLLSRVLHVSTENINTNNSNTNSNNNNSDLDVKQVDMLWINRQSDDFILDNEVQLLENSVTASTQFNVVRAVDKHLLDDNEEVRMLSARLTHILPQFSSGSVAVVIGTDTVVNKAVQSLVSKGFDTNEIMQIRL